MTESAKLGDEGALTKYSITIKPCSSDLISQVNQNSNFLMEFFMNLTVTYNLVRVWTRMERDSKDIKHIHACIIGPANLFINSKRYKGWHIHIKKEYNASGWENYCFKDYRKDIEQAKAYYESHYCFIDNAHYSPFKLSF